MNEGIAHFLPARSIGGFSLYVTVEETMTDEAEITDHPVEIGSTVSDHVFLKPTSVTVRALSGPQHGPLDAIYEQLRAIWRARGLIDVVTGKAAYRNMVLKRLACQTDAITENVVAFTAELRELILVSVETVAVPPSSRHKNAAKTGAVQETGTKQPTRYANQGETLTEDTQVLAGSPDPTDTLLKQGTGLDNFPTGRGL